MQSWFDVSQQTFPPRGLIAGEVIERSTERLNSVAASGVAMNIFIWFAPSAMLWSNVKVPTDAPDASKTTRECPVTELWPSAQACSTTNCAFGCAAVPGNTSTILTSWNVADAAAGTRRHAAARRRNERARECTGTSLVSGRSVGLRGF